MKHFRCSYQDDTRALVRYRGGYLKWAVPGVAGQVQVL